MCKEGKVSTLHLTHFPLCGIPLDFLISVRENITQKFQ
jgi:hypothetical protein